MIKFLFLMLGLGCLVMGLPAIGGGIIFSLVINELLPGDKGPRGDHNGPY
jgi:hypothetical protein